ncbi:MAG: CHASE3 domain-containing protein, partial [Actinomycetota bacterium]
MADPARRELWSVITGKGTPSLRGLLTRAVIGVGLVLGVLAALAIVGLVGATSSYRDDQQAAVDRAKASEVILADLLNAETGVSGYTLTGGTSYLVPYVRAEDTYPRNIRRLRTLVAGEPPLVKAVAAFDTAAKEWFTEARDLVELRQTGRISEAVARIGEGVDKQRLDQLRAEHADLRELVEQQRQQALETADQRRLWTILAVVAGVLLAVLVVATASRALWRRAPARTLAVDGLPGARRGRRPPHGARGGGRRLHRHGSRLSP